MAVRVPANHVPQLQGTHIHSWKVEVNDARHHPHSCDTSFDTPKVIAQTHSGKVYFPNIRWPYFKVQIQPLACLSPQLSKQCSSYTSILVAPLDQLELLALLGK
jgi:hypothetical protein